VADELAVWLYGARVAIIDEERHRLRLTYSAEALSRYPLGAPLLSLALPLQPERHTDRVVRPFLDGLLPEGQSRLAVAYDFDLLASDTLGLLRAIGRDCAGALVIQPASEPNPPPDSALRADPLSDSEIEGLVTNLRTAPLGIDERVRISLGGVQEKLVLTQMPGASWGRPVDGTPSTHILKPEIARFPGTVENEAFCMRIALHLGLPVATVDTTRIAGRKLLVVERYDRLRHPDGTVERIHQEDLCQATGNPPEKKYEEHGGPNLRRIAQVLQAAAAPGVLDDLLRAVTLNLIIGNGDAHAKNFSILHGASGSLALAPLYDLLCTLHYGDNRLAMAIDGISDAHQVTAARMAAEASRWGISRGRATEVIDDLLDRSPEAIGVARDETDGLPDAIVATVRGQLRHLRPATTRAREPRPTTRTQ
jgi:serine/threonine-protein kinase HipA